MRKTILGLGISLDGYIARPDGAVDFLFMPKDYSMADFFRRVDTCVMGRKTYDKGLEMSSGKMPDYGMGSYVMSHSQPPGARNGVTFVDQSPARLLAAIRKRKGKDIWLMGGGELARAFLQADLVDELYLGIVPVLLGNGIPLFPAGFPERKFTLTENRTYSKGLIALTYRRGRR
jgi:dihydrofolate reductase